MFASLKAHLGVELEKERERKGVMVDLVL
jgi:hypothetical protein